MPSFAGKYQHYKNEDIDEYFRVVGVPYVGRKMIAISSPLMEITHEGETMTIKNTSLMRTIESTFKIGTEYDEHMPAKTIKSKTTFLNDCEMETKSVIPDTKENCSRHYLFTDDECIITLTHDKAKTAGKRYFRRLQT